MERDFARILGLAGGLVVFGILVAMAQGDTQWLLGAVMALMVIWWITEAVPLAATALVPLVLLPLLGLVPLAQVSANYTKPIILLMFAGLTLALAIQRANLHVRIVIWLLRMTGGNVNGVIFGFMLSACLLSMWLSNTATTAAMLPIALSFIAILVAPTGAPAGAPAGAPSPALPPVESLSPENRKLSLTILLGIAYAANIGGTATPIGTGPNSIFIGAAAARYNIQVDFLDWMLVVLPWTLTMLAAMWFVMTHFLFRNQNLDLTHFHESLRAREKTLGAITYEEKCISALFGTMIGLLIIYRWLPVPNLHYAIIGLGAVLCAFALPIKLRPLTFMLEWRDMKELNWGVLILLGGGLALGDGMTHTGFSSTLGDKLLASFGFMGDNIWIAFAALGAGLTEFASNIGMVSTMLPVIFDVADKTGANPIFYGIPLTIATSCAFMMPIATPPNALVFSSNYIRVSEMLRAGFVMNLIALALMVLIFTWTIPLVLG